MSLIFQAVALANAAFLFFIDTSASTVCQLLKGRAPAFLAELFPREGAQ